MAPKPRKANRYCITHRVDFANLAAQLAHKATHKGCAFGWKMPK